MPRRWKSKLMATLGLVWTRKVGTVRPRTDIRGDSHNPAEKSSGSATRAYKPGVQVGEHVHGSGDSLAAS